MHNTAKELVDAQPKLARKIFQTVCSLLDESPALQRPEVRLVYAESAFFIGSIDRELGELTAAIAWEEIAAQVADSAIGSGHRGPSSDTAKGISSRSITMIGNCYFDQLQFGSAVAYHVRGLMAQLELDVMDPIIELPAVLNQLVDEPSRSAPVLLTLFNLGNSLGASRSESYGVARIALLLGVAALPDVVGFARTRQGRLITVSLVAEMKRFHIDRFPEEWRVAWRCVQDAVETAAVPLKRGGGLAGPA